MASYFKLQNPATLNGRETLPGQRGGQGSGLRPLMVAVLRGLLAVEAVAIVAAVAGSLLHTAWAADAVGLALTLPMAALALSSAVDLSERRDRR